MQLTQPRGMPRPAAASCFAEGVDDFHLTALRAGMKPPMSPIVTASRAPRTRT